jgi:hypothetical protein
VAKKCHPWRQTLRYVAGVLNLEKGAPPHSRNTPAVWADLIVVRGNVESVQELRTSGSPCKPRVHWGVSEERYTSNHSSFETLLPQGAKARATTRMQTCVVGFGSLWGGGMGVVAVRGILVALPTKAGRTFKKDQAEGIPLLAFVYPSLLCAPSIIDHKPPCIPLPWYERRGRTGLGRCAPHMTHLLTLPRCWLSLTPYFCCCLLVRATRAESLLGLRRRWWTATGLSRLSTPRIRSSHD